MEVSHTFRLIRFGAFELDLRAGELRKGGIRIRLSEQPFQVLAMLLEHPGDLVMREELQQRLWSNDTFVDFDAGLNRAISRIREALGDSADQPRYLETLPKRGYRFIFPVDHSGLEVIAPPPSNTEQKQYARSLSLQVLERRRTESRGSLKEACGEDELRREDAKMLEAHAESGSFVEKPALAMPSHLEKDQGLRYQAASDLCSPPNGLKQDKDSSRLATTAPPPRLPTQAPKNRWIWALYGMLGILLVAGSIIWYAMRRSGSSSETVLTPIPLTSYPGSEDSPSFSPDGSQVAFSWNGDKQDNFDIYVKQIGMEPPFRLTNDPAEDLSPAWSPDGRFIAFLRILSPNKRAIIQISQRGGRERLLAEYDYSNVGQFPSGPCLAWTPDSKWLATPWPDNSNNSWALYLISIETGEKRKLTNPPKSFENTSPAFSPDGRYLSFARESGLKSDICLLRLMDGYLPQGEPEKVTSENPRNFGIAWMPEGGEIVFSSGTITTSGLFRIAAFKPARPRQLGFGQENASAPAISLRGNRLAYAVGREDINIWRVDLKDPGQKPGAPIRFIASTRTDMQPAYSPDGKKIAFISDRSGPLEIWVCDNDGSNPIPLTSMEGPIVSKPNWSPDGKTIAFNARFPGEGAEIYLINAEGGVPRRITTGLRNCMWPSWSRDGQSIYICGGRGDTWGIWKIPFTGGEAVQITRNGGDVPQESPDGKYIYFINGPIDARSVWRIPVGGGEEVKILDPVYPAECAIGKDGIYFLKMPNKKDHSDLCLYEFATGKSHKILTVEREVPSKITASPDGKMILYPQVDESGSDLMLVENFR